MSEITVSTITTIVRAIISDFSVLRSDIFTYTNSNVFTLTEDNISSISDVTINDVSSGVTYTFDSTHNKVTVSSSLTTSDTVEIAYNCTENYSDTEIENYISSALVQISIHNYANFEIINSTVFPEPSLKEKNLIASITAVLMEPNNLSISLPGIGLRIPTATKSKSVQDMVGYLIAIFKKDTTGIWGVA